MSASWCGARSTACWSVRISTDRPRARPGLWGAVARPVTTTSRFTNSGSRGGCPAASRPTAQTKGQTKGQTTAQTKGQTKDATRCRRAPCPRPACRSTAGSARIWVFGGPLSLRFRDKKTRPGGRAITSMSTLWGLVRPLRPAVRRCAARFPRATAQPRSGRLSTRIPSGP